MRIVLSFDPTTGTGIRVLDDGKHPSPHLDVPRHPAGEPSKTDNLTREGSATRLKVESVLVRRVTPRLRAPNNRGLRRSDLQDAHPSRTADLIKA